MREKRLSPIHNVAIAIAAVVLFSFFLTSCSESTAVPPNAEKATPSPGRDNRLQDEITQIAALAKGHIGVSAMILETGETVAALNPRDHFPMQSVYKLPISMAVMKQVDGGRLKLEQKVAVTKIDFVRAGQHSPIRDRNPNGAEITVNELIRFAIVESDGTASDVLMKLAGGPQAVQAYLNDLSVNDLIVLNTEKEIGQDWQVQYRNFSTPDAAVALLRALHEKRGLSESSQGLILKYLVESTPGAKRLKGLLPAGTIVAHKTGTSGTEKGITAATNDIGIITLPNGNHLAIAVFVSDSPTDEATREGVIAKIAKLVVDSQRQ
ncbi:MAG TPA: class A beta-lactamase [Pyrinomonadaceae bacterium]|nr:class A beta-lactamase [Pyrinomonadaceae bacterium]